MASYQFLEEGPEVEGLEIEGVSRLLIISSLLTSPTDLLVKSLSNANREDNCHLPFSWGRDDGGGGGLRVRGGVKRG